MSAQCYVHYSVYIATLHEVMINETDHYMSHNSYNLHLRTYCT